MKYFLKRLLRTIPIVIGVTLITFSLIYHSLLLKITNEHYNTNTLTFDFHLKNIYKA